MILLKTFNKIDYNVWNFYYYS